MGLVVRSLRELDQSKLHGVVTIGGRRFALHHHARSGLQQRDRNNLPVGAEHLAHPDLFA
jgi:hypothetical protein